MIAADFISRLPRARAKGALLACLLVMGCREAPVRYATRGRITERIGSGQQAQVAIHHERIQAFKDREGKLAPMGSMVMLFGVAPSLSAASLTPGTPVRFEFEVRWDERPTLVITRFERLAASTPLVLTREHDHGSQGSGTSH